MILDCVVYILGSWLSFGVPNIVDVAYFPCSVVNSIQIEISLIRLTRTDTEFVPLRSGLLIFPPFRRFAVQLPAVFPARSAPLLRSKRFIQPRSRHRSDLLKTEHSCHISAPERNDGT